MRRPVLPFQLCLAAATFVAGGATSADWRTDIGWDAFKIETGSGFPDGSGVLVLQAEADASSSVEGFQYLPNPTASDMSGKTITPLSEGGNSNHALTVAKRFYGNTTSIAPGVTDIHAWYAGEYLDGFNALPSARKVHCNAWIADFDSDPAGNLATLDSAINSRGFLVVGGLDNGSATTVPHVFATTYNALSVGLSNGNHSRNGTTVAGYGSGRVKPEIVLPDTFTSFATGGASSLAAVLYEVATTTGHTDATNNSEVMKAIIMAGATKREFDGWDRTLSRPLDEVFGAGEANILNSYRILDAGPQVPGAVPPAGWSYNFISDPRGPNDFTIRSYDFTIPPTKWAEDFSVVLNWNYSGSGTARDLKLELFSLDGGITLVDESDSPVDNVEHIYQRNLPAGDYRITVSRADTSIAAINYGLAWEAQLGAGPGTLTGESINNLPEVTVTGIFKDRPYVIERSVDLHTWTVVHAFTPTTWEDYVWEDPAGFALGTRAFYRSGFTP